MRLGGVLQRLAVAERAARERAPRRRFDSSYATTPELTKVLAAMKAIRAARESGTEPRLPAELESWEEAVEIDRRVRDRMERGERPEPTRRPLKTVRSRVQPVEQTAPPAKAPRSPSEATTRADHSGAPAKDLEPRRPRISARSKRETAEPVESREPVDPSPKRPLSAMDEVRRSEAEARSWRSKRRRELEDASAEIPGAIF